MTRFTILIAGVLSAAPLAALAQSSQLPVLNECGGNQKLVWVDVRSHTYRPQSPGVDFGKSGPGRFQCEKEAVKQGNRPAKQ